MKRPNGNKTNAEWISDMCPYDLLVMVNDNMRRIRNKEARNAYCILEVVTGGELACKAGNCAECIRRWRLEPHER